MGLARDDEKYTILMMESTHSTYSNRGKPIMINDKYKY
jgi:hypothetical protein